MPITPLGDRGQNEYTTLGFETLLVKFVEKNLRNQLTRYDTLT